MCVSIAGWPRVVDDGEAELSVWAACDSQGRSRFKTPVRRPIGAGLGRRRESVGLGIGSGEMCPGVDGWSVCSAGFERPSLN